MHCLLLYVKVSFNFDYRHTTGVCGGLNKNNLCGKIFLWKI